MWLGGWRVATESLGQTLHQRMLIWSAYALLLLAAPWVFTSSLHHALLSQMGIAVIVCLSYNMLLGQGGMLSFGHAVYTGMGAFFAIHALNMVHAGGAFPVSLIPVLAGVGSLLVALLLGSLTTRIAGLPFAMITLGVGELVAATALMFPGFFGGEGGISGNRVSGSPVLGISYGAQIEVYYLIALYTFGCTALMYAFTCTPLGRLLNAVRDNPERVAFMGYNPQVVRYMSFVIAAFFAGIAGGLAALNFEMASAEMLSSYRSGAYLLFTYVGGSSVFFGPIIGGILMVLGLVLLSEFTQAWLLYLGLIFVWVVLAEPGGLAALLMTQFRWIKAGYWQRLWLSFLVLAVTAGVTLLGAAALIELTYHLQLNAALGPKLLFMGVTLNTQSPDCWFGIVWVMLTGGTLFGVCRSQLVREWNVLAHSAQAEATVWQTR